MSNRTNYKEQPFDLETALKNPDWVYFRNGYQPPEWHYFKEDKSYFPIVAVLPEGGTGSFKKDGSYRINKGSEVDLILRVPVTKMKVTVFVWDDGSTQSYSESESKGIYYDTFCEQAEQGLCARHEFEVEVNEQP